MSYSIIHIHSINNIPYIAIKEVPLYVHQNIKQSSTIRDK
jgi:hypothetical protein